MYSRVLFLLFVLSIGAVAQETESQPQPAMSERQSAEATPDRLVIPGGTKVPLVLKHALSSKSARVGDGVYLETTFPVVVNDRVVIPAGTYVQGKVTQVKRPGRMKGRAEMLLHFTTLVYPNGYTVTMPAGIESVPGAEGEKVEDEEGTVRHEGQKGKDTATVLTSAGSGVLIGALNNGAKGAAVGGAIGAAVGAGYVLFTRGNDIRMESGSSVEMVLHRDIMVDSARLPDMQQAGNYRQLIVPPPPPQKSSGPPSLMSGPQIR